MNKFILSVKFFKTVAGNEPVRDFLLKMSQADRKIIGTDLKEVQFGWPMGMPLVRKMNNDLWEVRSTLEGRIARTLFTVVESQMVLLHIFIKKSAQTSKVDLQTANKRLQAVRGTLS